MRHFCYFMELYTYHIKTKLKYLSDKVSHLNYSSHVLFHYFKDFPIGLLALRPVRIPVDRHFIRSSLRLFASTWAKLEQEEEIRTRAPPKFRERNRPNDSSRMVPYNVKPNRNKNSGRNTYDRQKRSNTMGNNIYLPHILCCLFLNVLLFFSNICGFFSNIYGFFSNICRSFSHL